MLLGVVACFTTPPTLSLLLCIAQYAAEVATGTEAVDFVLSTLHDIVAERCAARCSFLASIVAASKRWSNKRRASARRARIAVERARRAAAVFAESAAHAERARELRALVALQFARGAPGADVPEPVSYRAYKPTSVYDATAKEKQARSGSLVSALVAARVGYLYGVRAAPAAEARVVASRGPQGAASARAQGLEHARWADEAGLCP